MSAPGDDILSTLPNNTYGNLSGTSQAAPHVTGAIALLFAAACEDLIQAYHDNPPLVAFSFITALFNGADPLPSLSGKTRYGRLNIQRSLQQLTDQFHTDLFLTGTETTSRQYDGINTITAEDYIVSGNLNVRLRAGQKVFIEPNSNLQPGITGKVEVFIDEHGFDCSVSLAPLSVGLGIPGNPICTGNTPFTVTAFPTGGEPPYSFVWFTRPISSSNFNTLNINSPVITLLPTEDFFIKAQVTDDQGAVAMSPTELAECGNNKLASQDTVELSELSGIRVTEDHNEADTATNRYIDQLYIRQSFNVFPNPTWTCNKKPDNKLSCIFYLV